MKRNWKLKIKKLKSLKSKYSGVILVSDRNSYCDTDKRITDGRKPIGILNLVLCDQNFENRTKTLIFKWIVQSVMLYGIGQKTKY